MRIENVIILGAGASASEGAPLQKDLFGEYYTARRKGTLETSDYQVPAELIQFFLAAFGMDLSAADADKANQPTLEEALGIIEIALVRSESFKDFGITADNPRLQTVREQLILLIGAILALPRRRSGYHGRLVASLAKAGWLLKTAIVSLNYDIYIDNAIDRARDKFDVDLDYGTDFANFRHRHDWQKPRCTRSLPLYKLHGSLNWLYCPRCTELTLTPKVKGFLSHRHRGRCPCNEELIPIIVPPSFFKEMSNFHLQSIWRKTEQALVGARNIVFCGYSLPDADIHLKYMLKRAEVNRTGPAAAVFVVNDHGRKTKEERIAEFPRYLRLFRDPSKVRFKKLSFEDFCDQGPACLTKADGYDSIDPV